MKKLIIVFIAVAAACLVLFTVYRRTQPEDIVPAAVNPINNEDTADSYADCADIFLSDAGSSAESGYVTVEKEGIIITHSGHYRISGKLSDGQIIINARNKGTVVLVLDGADISCTGSAAVYALSNNKVILHLAEGSENRLSSAGEFVNIDTSNIDGAVFTKSDLTVNGSGSLSVSCETGHGIVCKDYLKITAGRLNITAEKKGIAANDGAAFENADITVSCGTAGLHTGNIDGSAEGDIYLYSGTCVIDTDGDAVHSSRGVYLSGGTLKIACGDDAIHADTLLCITGGTVDITESYEGLEGNRVVIAGGEVNVTASDDGINSSGGSDGFFTNFNSDQFKDDEHTEEDDGILISGGRVCVNAGGDGVDSNSTLTVTGGELIVDGPVDNGNGPLDYETAAVITGGKVVAVGSSGMAVSFGEGSKQPSILVRLSSTHPAGSVIVLQEEDGTEILTHTSAKAYTSVVVSCPALQVGKTYLLQSGTESFSIELDSLSYETGEGFGFPAGKR